MDTCLLSAEQLYIQLATHRDIPTSIRLILGLPTGRNEQVISTFEKANFPKKMQTLQPRGTMNLDNSYFRQDSDLTSLPTQQQQQRTNEVLEDLLTMTPLMEL